MMNVNTLTTNKKSWDEVAEKFFGRNPLPEYGPMAPSEDDLHLSLNGEKTPTSSDRFLVR